MIFDVVKTFRNKNFSPNRAKREEKKKRKRRNIIVEQTYVALTLLRVFLIHVPEKSVEGSFPLLGERRRVERGFLAVY